MPTSDEHDAPAPGTVIVLPFPYADRLAEKRRPALVISSQEMARRHRIVWVAMITSADNAGWENDVEIKHLDRCGLRAPSVVRPAKLATIDLARILRALGPVGETDFAAVRAAIVRSLGVVAG